MSAKHAEKALAAWEASTRKDGELQVKGTGFLGMTTWTVRFFTLILGPPASLVMRDAKNGEVMVESGEVTAALPVPDAGGLILLQVYYKGGPGWLLRCDTEDDRADWIYKIQRARMGHTPLAVKVKTDGTAKAQ